MPETIEVKSRSRAGVEFFREIFSARRYLPYKGFARRNKAVGLDVPTPDYLLFAPLGKFLNFAEQFFVVLFDIFVEQNLVMAKNVIVFFGEFYRAVKRCESRARPFVPIPLPHGIEVRIAY